MYLRTTDGWEPVAGAEGASAYELAVANGFVGTEQEWLASLDGPPGPPPEPQAIASAVSDYLTSNPILPPQSGQAGNFLSTDGAEPSWTDITPPVTLILLLDNALA